MTAHHLYFALALGVGPWLAAGPVSAADFSPGDLAGLVLWLDADDSETLTLDPEGGRVLSWADKSEAGHEALPVEGVAPPIHLAGLLNGRGLVRFDGSNALLFDSSEALDFEGLDDFSLFVVLDARSNGSLLAKSAGGRMQYRFHIPNEGTLRVVLGQGGEQIDTRSATEPGRFHLLGAIRSGGAEGRFELFFDGEAEASARPGAGKVPSRASLGARDEGSATPLRFDLAELLLFRRGLDESERLQVEAYLVEKFSLDEQRSGLEPLTRAPEGSFTLAAIPDTQRFHGPGSGRGDEDGEPRNPAFDSRTAWLVENLEAQRVVFVTHMGDIVDRNNHHQWRVARELMDRFHGRVPYGISVGNHDLVGSSGDSSLFQEYFGAERFLDQPWYGGSYEGRPGHSPQVSGNNANSYQLFSAEGLDFVIVHVECNAPDDVLAWVDTVLENHADRMAIVTTHMYLGGIDRHGAREPQGRMRWKKVHGERGNTPEEMWEKSFRRHANLFLVLCGDQSASISHRQESRGEHGNLVHEVLQDYPRGSDDSDWLRLFRFHPEEELVRVYTYSPAQDRLCDGVGHLVHPDDHQFTLELSDALARHREAAAR